MVRTAAFQATNRGSIPRGAAKYLFPLQREVGRDLKIPFFKGGKFVNKFMRILAIETSCDETSIAVMQFNADGSFKLLSNIVSSQVKIHAPYGGVVPMLAKREHQKNLVPILKQALKDNRLLSPEQASSARCGASASKAKKDNPSTRLLTRSGDKLTKILDREPELLKKLLPFLIRHQKPDIDLIAVTNGPGLEPALWVGVNFAKALAYFWNLPVIPINHVEAHITANWLDHKPYAISHKLIFPAISLVVSGGHTQLIFMRDFGNYKILGETRDDAAGEAFDKLAKMLNLGYPGGTIVAQIAQSVAVGQRQNIAVRQPKIKVKFPRPMINSKDYDFSFSGLKTAALYFVKTLAPAQIKKLTPAICAEFQQAEIDVLVSKTIRAAKEFGAKTVLLSGGVASNDLLRETLSLIIKRLPLNFFVPPKEFCTDNAAMIGMTAFFKTKNQIPKTKNYNWQKIQVEANLRLPQS